MNTYHVTFFYYAIGMERPEKRDFGTIKADSKDGAIRKILKREYYSERDNWEFLSGCMTAKVVLG